MMDAEEYANYKVTTELNPDQYLAVATVLTAFCDEYKDTNEPVVQQMIRDIHSIEWKRTQ